MDMSSIQAALAEKAFGAVLADAEWDAERKAAEEHRRAQVRSVIAAAPYIGGLDFNKCLNVNAGGTRLCEKEYHRISQAWSGVPGAPLVVYGALNHTFECSDAALTLHAFDITNLLEHYHHGGTDHKVVSFYATRMQLPSRRMYIEKLSAREDQQGDITCELQLESRDGGAAQQHVAVLPRTHELGRMTTELHKDTLVYLMSTVHSINLQQSAAEHHVINYINNNLKGIRAGDLSIVAIMSAVPEARKAAIKNYFGLNYFGLKV